MTVTYASMRREVTVTCSTLGRLAPREVGKNEDGNSIRGEESVNRTEGDTMKSSIVVSLVALVLLALFPSCKDQGEIVNYLQIVSLSLSFTDFVKVRIPPPISTTPATTITQTFVIPGAQEPTKFLQYTLSNVQANARYDVLIPREIADTEGDRLPQDYRIVFYTRP